MIQNHCLREPTDISEVLSEPRLSQQTRSLTVRTEFADSSDFVGMILDFTLDSEPYKSATFMTRDIPQLGRRYSTQTGEEPTLCLILRLCYYEYVHLHFLTKFCFSP